MGKNFQDYSWVQDFEADFPHDSHEKSNLIFSKNRENVKNLLSWNQDFEADFPQKVSLKILN